MQFRLYESAVLDYLKENGPASRADLQKATNISRDGIFTLLAELIERDLIVKTGQSVSTRYHYKEKKSLKAVILSDFAMQLKP